MLAQLKAANRGHAGGVVPLLAAAEQLPLRDASLDVVTAFNCVHHFDLGRFLTSVARVCARRPAVHLHPHPEAEHANDLGPLLPRFHRARAAPAQPGGDPERRQADRRAQDGRNTDLPASAHEHGRTAQGPGRGAPLLTFSSTPRRSCARPSRPSWPGCPAPRSAGLTSTCWSSPAGSPQPGGAPARAAGRTRRSRIRPSRSAPGASVRLQEASWRRRADHPVMRPVDCWRRPSAERPNRRVRAP